MTDRPILFSAPMVRSLLNDLKSQTRRILTPHNTFMDGMPWSKLANAQVWDWNSAWVDNGPSPAGNAGPYLKLPWLSGDADPFAGTIHRIYPKTQPGDRLYVREAWRAEARLDAKAPRDIKTNYPGIKYIATDEPDDFGIEGKYRQAMHMPRWVSRLTLIVTDVRIERLQDISEGDAIAEGIERHYSGWMPYTTAFYEADAVTPANYHLDPRESYRSLWNKINGPGAWEANPWVVAVTFEVIKQHIDEVQP